MPSWPWPGPGTFRRAALEQRVSVSSLSQRLRDLEERLGVRLMNRTTRSVGLTEAGELLLARVGPAMHRCHDALDQVRGLRGVPSGRLRINAPPPAIDLVLAPMVAPFLQQYPQDRTRDRRRQLVHRYCRQWLRCRRALWRASGAGHDCGLARAAATLCGGGITATMSRSMAGRSIRGICSITLHPHPVRQRCHAGLGVREGWPRRESIAAGETDRELSRSGAAARSMAVGFWPTFEGYVRDEMKSGALVSVLDDWCDAVSRTVSVLSQPSPTAARAGRIGRVRRDWRKRERSGKGA